MIWIHTPLTASTKELVPAFVTASAQFRNTENAFHTRQVQYFPDASTNYANAWEVKIHMSSNE